MESKGTGKGIKVNMKNIDPNEIMLKEQRLHSHLWMHMPYMHTLWLQREHG